jgi:hypothetical protein
MTEPISHSGTGAIPKMLHTNLERELTVLPHTHRRTAKVSPSPMSRNILAFA